MPHAADQVVTRFAPSPTGHLHVGGVRTALYCWAFARRFAGRFLIRIEDTDLARSSDASARGILEDLTWLGIVWDEGPVFDCPHDPATGDRPTRIGGDARGVGPFFQSLRRHIYDHYVQQLIDADLAYHAFETPEQLEAQRQAARARRRTFRYDRSALQLPREERLRRAAAGEPHVVRFHVPDEPVEVEDRILGPVRFAAGELDDFVIRKADGMPTYHFAVVVDDELMGVTHVLRGQEHLANTPRHVLLQRALGFRTPVYAHLPLIFNPDGSKMSKRDKDRAAREACRRLGLDRSPVPEIPDATFTAWLGDTRQQLDPDALRALADALRIELPEIDVEDFRASGYLPEVLCNYVALLGWSPGGDIERFDLSFLAQRFDLDRVGRANARFDRAKLLAFNGEAFARMSPDQFRQRWLTWCARYAPAFMELAPEALRILAEAVRPRAKTFGEAARLAQFAVQHDEQIRYDDPAVIRVLDRGDPTGRSLLAAFVPALAELARFEPASIDAAIRSFCEQRGLGVGRVAQPLRAAVTGSTVSPPIDATLAVLGRDRVLRRVERCLAARAGTRG